MPIADPILAALGIVSSSLGVTAGPMSPDPFDNLVVSSVAAEMTGVEPGRSVWIGVHFEIKDGWHTYWPGQNDSGFGTSIEVTAPEGARVGEPRWPAPTRYLAPGNILDHVHEDGVTALVQLTAPEDAVVGSSLTLSFELSWLVCDDVCIPGWESLTLTTPVVESPEPVVGVVADRFAAARARLPAQPETADAIEVDWNGSVATVRVMAAKNLSFYPDEGGSAVNELHTAGTTTSGALRLSFDAPEPVLSGVLEIHGSGDESKLFVIRSERGHED